MRPEEFSRAGDVPHRVICARIRRELTCSTTASAVRRGVADAVAELPDGVTLSGQAKTILHIRPRRHLLAVMRVLASIVADRPIVPPIRVTGLNGIAYVTVGRDVIAYTRYGARIFVNFVGSLARVTSDDRRRFSNT